MPGERRFRRNRRSQAVLPLHSRNRLSNAISCWYCDLKISSFNGFLYALGSKHAWYLKIWFTIGVGASFVAFAVMTVFLLKQLACTVQLFGGSHHFCYLPSAWSIGVPFQDSDLVSMSLMDVGVLSFSTLISVLVHEFGHAIAAASQGIQIEYIALFLSVIFPGALVAFNYNLLQALPSLSALRIYCAGIWHNFVLSILCGLALLSLPGVLYPFYIHGERPMVLSVSSGSPLTGYLSPGDTILSLNGLDIHNPEEWFEKTSRLDPKVHNLFNYSLYPDDSMRIQGYCIPDSWIKDQNILSTDDENACPEDLVAFIIKRLDGNHSGDGHDIPMRKYYCLLPQDVLKLKKCGDAYQRDESNQLCLCLEDEGWLVPVQRPHAVWAEVSVSRPYVSKCWKFKPNETSTALKGSDSGSTPCVETFIFVGDISVANSVKLTAYQPRWAFGYFSIHLPKFLEIIFLSMLRVSASLGLLNCMPVFYLDGESMMEVSFNHITCINRRGRQRILWLLLSGGTSLFAFTIGRVFFSIYQGYI